MKTSMRWQILFGIALVLVAVLLHYILFLIFGHPETILAFLGKKIAFIPLEVLFITLIVHQLLNRHERAVLIQKMNMLVGSFFSEIGNNLLVQLNRMHDLSPEEKKRFKIRLDWTDKDFDRAMQDAEAKQVRLQGDPEVLEDIRRLLEPKRASLLLLLQNPNLLEHEPFSDLLWSVFHLLEELSRRDDLHSLPKTDINHLTGDARRVFKRLIVEWVRYMKHLRKDYPYLHSLEMRINPFDDARSIIVTE